MRSVVIVALCARASVAAPDAKPAPSPPKPPPHHQPVAAVDIAACAVDVFPTPNEIRSLADVPHERGVALPSQTVFALHDAKQIAANEKRLLAMFPAEWKPQITLDRTGMAHRVMLELSQLPMEQLATQMLAFVKSHPCLFGIVDPSKLAAHVDGSNVILDYTPRSMGSISVIVVPPKDKSRTTVLVARHLWPVLDLVPKLDVKYTHKRYLGRTFERRREMFGHAGGSPGIRVDHLPVGELDLRVEPIVALWCQQGSLYAMGNVYTELLGDPLNDKVLAELPAPIDTVTGKPLPGGWIAPVPVDAGVSYTPNDRMNQAGRTCLGIRDEQP